MANRWTVSQIGPRQHYGVPRGFAAAGTLRRLYTEAWCRRGRRLLARGPAVARALAARHHPGVPDDLVVSYDRRAIYDYLREVRDRGRRTNEDQYREYLRVGSRFASTVADDLARQPLDPAVDVFLGFNTGCLETFDAVRRRGVVTVCDQIDPGEVEERMVQAEAAKWPGWQRMAGGIPAEYWERMRREWSAADLVLVNSDWSKAALIEQGVPAGKLFVVPLAFEANPSERSADRTGRPDDGPFTVLWVGAVLLRKGIPYLIEAARRLLTDDPRVRFVVAGPVQISDEAVASAPANVTFVGRVTRDRIGQLYREADVYVLPTISDGFALTQVEAMARGLPVIATPNCAAVVAPGVDGLIVPAADAAALADAIAGLSADRPRVREMGRRAVATSERFSLGRQTELCEAAVAAFRDGCPVG